jgi:hypothetical protein
MPKHPPKPKGRPRKENKELQFPERLAAWMTREQKEYLLTKPEGASAWIRLQIDNALEVEE